MQRKSRWVGNIEKHLAFNFKQHNKRWVGKTEKHLSFTLMENKETFNF